MWYSQHRLFGISHVPAFNEERARVCVYILGMQPQQQVNCMLSFSIF